MSHVNKFETIFYSGNQENHEYYMLCSNNAINTFSIKYKIQQVYILRCMHIEIHNIYDEM